MEHNILNSIIGRTITDIKIMSFYINRKLICDLITLYIKVDTGLWYKFTTSEGRNIIEQEKEELIGIMLDEIEDEFAYPIRNLNLDYNNSKIKNIRNYIYKNYADEFIGFYFELDNGAVFSLFEEGDCLKIYNGILTEYNYSVVEIH